MRHVVSGNIPRTQLCKDPVPIKSKDVEPSIQISKFEIILWGKLVRFNRLRKKSFVMTSLRPKPHFKERNLVTVNTGYTVFP